MAIIKEFVSATIHTTSEVFADLVPGKQVRDWKQRWTLIQSDLEQLLAGTTAEMSSESIHSFHQQLLSFYIHAYHFKDSLILTSGLSSTVIEGAINNDPRLALLADLANQDKHTVLNTKKRPPRSGAIPVIEQISGADSLTADVWHLVVKIRHGQTVLDGLNVAKNAVAAWQEKLGIWGLI